MYNHGPARTNISHALGMKVLDQVMWGSASGVGVCHFRKQNFGTQSLFADRKHHPGMQTFADFETGLDA